MEQAIEIPTKRAKIAISQDLRTNKPNDNYWFYANQNFKKSNIELAYTEEQALEYKACLQDPAHFVRNYCKIINLDEGLVNFDLYPYQEEMFKSYNENRFSIVLAARQSGKTQAVAAYLLWFAIFNPTKTVGVLANKGDTAREIVMRISLMLENLPFFLQPGMKTLNKGSLEFDNTSRILSASTSSSSIRGKSLDLLYLDEFAFINNDTEFYTATYPVISSSKNSKVIITSSANGVGNMFYRLWQGAVSRTNEYTPIRVDWWSVPGRDEKWKEQTISNTSQRQFDQEYGNNFLGSSDTLLSANYLLSLQAVEPEERRHDDSFTIYEYPINTEELEDGEFIPKYYVFVDVARGRGQDYSVVNVIKQFDSNLFKQVAVYRNNMISPLLLPSIVYKIVKWYNDAFVVVENNDNGNIVATGLYYELEYENMYVGSVVKSNSIGLEMTKKTKSVGCSNIKDICESGKLEVVDEETIKEMTNFEGKGKSYEASAGHDDIMMTLVAFGWFIGTEIFSSLNNDMRIQDIIREEKAMLEEENLLPFGYIDDFSEDEGPQYDGIYEIVK